MINWHRDTITGYLDYLSKVPDNFKQGAVAGAFDTETNGLHLKRCKPFIFQFGWVSADRRTGYAFAMDITAVPDHVQIIKHWHTLAQTLPIYLGHNVKFDLHMMRNLGVPYTYFSNVSDTQIFIRMAHDNIPIRFGGVSLALKDYASKYVTPTAKDHDRLIQQERTSIAKMYNMQLKQALGWTVKRIDAFFDDCCNTLADLPSAQDYLAYWDWHEALPYDLRILTRGKVLAEDVPYTMVNRQLLMQYAIEDIVLTLEVWLKCEPVALARQQHVGLRMEQQVIECLYTMESVGFDLDIHYVAQSYECTRMYLRQRRQDLIDLVGEPITASQHAKLKDYIERTWGIRLESSDDAAMQDLKHKVPESAELVGLLKELRRLEKWMSTYLFRFLGQDVLYTQIHQVGAASGRVSSDFQQFPKEGLKDKDGNILFNPRRAVKVRGGIYNQIVYLDYSQIELRVQALYTILLGEPDMNLCRAYFPYQCQRPDGTLYDYNDTEHVIDWAGEWYLSEDPSIKWTPVDVHGATTKAAFDIDESHPDFSKLRSLGKRVNFARCS